MVRFDILNIYVRVIWDAMGVFVAKQGVIMTNWCSVGVTERSVGFQELIKKLFRMYSQSWKPHQIYNETSLLLRPNNFFLLTRYFVNKDRLIYKSRTCLFIYFLPINSFSKQLCQNMLFKAGNWHYMNNNF